MREIPLTRGHVALIDDADYDLVSQYKWYASSESKGRKPYAVRTEVDSDGQKRMVYMHRAIMRPPSDMEVDHIDWSGLNNCRSNLRICTHSQNAAAGRSRAKSSSKYRGVFKYDERGRWYAQVRHEWKIHYLGCFDDEEAAARAYDAKAKELHGEFARPNFPEAS